MGSARRFAVGVAVVATAIAATIGGMRDPAAAPLSVPRRTARQPSTLPPGHPPVAHAAPGTDPLVAQAAFVVESPDSLAAPAATPRLPTSPRDFILPGTQPKSLATEIAGPDGCANCHANYRGLMVTPQPPDTETWTAWSGSMMAHAARDPVFLAALDIANADAPGSGEYCLRCHSPAGWLAGRARAADGSALTGTDHDGVSCGVCHRMVDPAQKAGHPARDVDVVKAITLPLTTVGSASFIADPLDYRRGPRDIAADWRPGFNPHFDAAGNLASPFHRDAALCGSCHDIDNPLLVWDPVREGYVQKPADAPPPSDRRFPIERTYTEWRLSAFNRPQGVPMPGLGGNKASVSTCQDCHMRDIAGAASSYFGEVKARNDIALHDLTGANTWVPRMLPLHPEFGPLFQDDPARAQALISGTLRARQMLRLAADLGVRREGDRLTVTVANRTGHKLPTGYAEGRRMWLQVEGRDRAGRVVFSSGAYDHSSATLAGYPDSPTLRVYEILHGVTDDWAGRLGLTAGHTFHFVLNNSIVADNRIPPRGYAFDAFEAAGAAPYVDSRPDRDRYADGQYWDTVTYALPRDVASGVVRLMYQTASREYIEFLRDANPNPAPNRGQVLYDLWERTGKSPPEVMAERRFARGSVALPWVVRRHTRPR